MFGGVLQIAGILAVLALVAEFAVRKPGRRRVAEAPIDLQAALEARTVPQAEPEVAELRRRALL